MTVEPFEARRLPMLPNEPEFNATMVDLLTAISGFPHPGDHADAAVWTVRWLREHPEACVVLGLREAK